MKKNFARAQFADALVWGVHAPRVAMAPAPLPTLSEGKALIQKKFSARRRKEHPRRASLPNRNA